MEVKRVLLVQLCVPQSNGIRSLFSNFQRAKSRADRWTDCYQGQLIAEEEEHNQNVLKVERKKNATNLACERRDNKIKQKTEVRTFINSQPMQ